MGGGRFQLQTEDQESGKSLYLTLLSVSGNILLFIIISQQARPAEQCTNYTGTALQCKYNQKIKRQSPFSTPCAALVETPTVPKASGEQRS